MPPITFNRDLHAYRVQTQGPCSWSLGMQSLHSKHGGPVLLSKSSRCQSLGSSGVLSLSDQPAGSSGFPVILTGERPSLQASPGEA